MGRVVRWFPYQDIAGPVLVPAQSPSTIVEAIAAKGVFPETAPPRRRAPLGTFVAFPAGLDDFPPAPDAPDVKFLVYTDRIERRRGLHPSQQQYLAFTSPEAGTPPAPFVANAAQAFYPDRLTRQRPAQQPTAVLWYPVTPATADVGSLQTSSVFPARVVRPRMLPIAQQQAVWTPSEAGSEVVVPTTTFVIRRLRRAPYLTGIDRGWVFYEQFQLDMEVGTGDLVTTPLASLRWSDDRGNTWTTAIDTSFGLEGEYRTRVVWRRLGKGRDRIFEVSFDDPVRIAIVNAYLELKHGKR